MPALGSHVNKTNNTTNTEGLLYLIDKGDITQNQAKEVFEQMIITGKGAQLVIKTLGVQQMTQLDLQKLVDKIIAQNNKAVEDYKAGKVASLGFLIGQIQREAKGQADANLAKNLLLEKLKK